MRKKKTVLLVSSIAVFPITLAVFRAATTALGSKWGYLAGLAVYWLYTLSITWIVAGKEKRYLVGILGGEAASRQRLPIGLAALLPVPAVFLISFLPHIGRLSPATGAVVLLAAVLNGSIEEIYWRGLYLKEYGHSLPVGLGLSTLLFTTWHFSLWNAEGIVYQGGLPALMGGAFVMGLLWSFVSRSVKNIKMCLLAHIIVNICAFTGLFVENGF
jgi:membrane protease YdiL (CAAX protease family)